MFLSTISSFKDLERKHFRLWREKLCVYLLNESLRHIRFFFVFHKTKVLNMLMGAELSDPMDRLCLVRVWPNSNARVLGEVLVDVF